MALLKTCRRCGALVPYPIAYCQACEPEAEVERQDGRQRSARRYNQARDKKYTAFYKTKGWRTLSAKVMQDHAYRCEYCGAIASEVHHDPPIQTPEGWAHRLDYAHCHPACLDCHNKEHDRFQSRKK